MDKADSDFLRQLFKENNELRGKLNALNRELYNKSIQTEAAEDEVKALKLRLEQEGKGTTSRPTVGTPTGTSTAKDLDEAMFALERKNTEIKTMREDMAKLQGQIEDEQIRNETMKKQLTDLQDEVQDLRQFRANALKEADMAQQRDGPEEPSDDLISLQRKLDQSESLIDQLRKQIITIASDANRKHNEQQNQLQGVEALLEGIRREYDEFIEVTKLENDSFRSMQQSEFDRLRSEYENHKLEQFEEKKRLMLEYQGLLYSLQAQFDEYRTTSEFLFSTELSKLEDELSSQALRYEQEIQYVIQAKDKFYADMMVAKDAKIMSLIEGSDLQNLMQKHELDIENLHKLHAREIEHIKSEQESEQKNLISLLQRQNVSLESKCEKLQTHLKSLEGRIKELMGVVEGKNRVIAEREDGRLKSEAEFQRKLDEASSRINSLSQEKEHLRHKVIRMALDAKGEGQNSIENMLKRISRETIELRGDYEEMSVKYDSLLSENQLLTKRLREKEKFSEFLEREVKKRTEEFTNMTRTFEDFLAGRAKQARKDRAERLVKLYGTTPEDLTAQDEAKAKKVISAWGPTTGKAAIVKAHVPAAGEKLTGHIPTKKIAQEELRAELDRGYTYAKHSFNAISESGLSSIIQSRYLRRFKTLSRAFATGDFRMISGPHHPTEDGKAMPGPWQKVNDCAAILSFTLSPKTHQYLALKTPLYKNLDDANLAAAKLYHEPKKEKSERAEVGLGVGQEVLKPKPVVYQSTGEVEKAKSTRTQDIFLYEAKSTVGVGGKGGKGKVDKPDEKKPLMVGGVQAH
ncbi:hypothetical protein HK097_010173 [Rhizophlyctis rosea]|uniref:Uncharacterized protein n=1 Tax=Rhizophlyctis rosea TaxID=64517 RepID=A0AAD5X2R2_9FUNG|nr:hypothetical protein HK097_010173 [Rhizophlyctis rosea]